MTKAWIVVNIGCIERGVTTNIVGVFTLKEQAEALADLLRKTMNWREGGQNDFEVFPLPPFDVIAEEYKEGLQQ